eukprot:2203439-Karenia_brevis.AAC.1
MDGYVTWGSGHRSQLQVWPWRLAKGIVEGIVRVKRSLQQSAFPETGSGPSDPVAPQDPLP